VGMLPYLLRNQLNNEALHDKHGPTFLINTGPLSGWALALNDVRDVRDVLSEGRPFDVAWPSARRRCICTCWASSAGLPLPLPLRHSPSRVRSCSLHVRSVYASQLVCTGPSHACEPHSLASLRCVWSCLQQRRVHALRPRADSIINMVQGKQRTLEQARPWRAALCTRS
jgi:hypothetical protein